MKSRTMNDIDETDPLFLACRWIVLRSCDHDDPELASIEQALTALGWRLNDSKTKWVAPRERQEPIAGELRTPAPNWSLCSICTNPQRGPNDWCSSCGKLIDYYSCNPGYCRTCAHK